MYWRILPHLTACVASDRLVLLDVRQDRYSAVPPPIAGPAIAWLERGDGAVAPAAFTNVLRGCNDSGTQPDNRDRTLVTPPVLAAASGPVGRVGLRSIVSVFGAVAMTWVALRTRKLSTILRARSRLRLIGPNLGAAMMRDRGRVFAQSRRWCPVPPNCLLDSLAFDRWSGCAGDVRVIFGVVGTPFEAHCWVQLDAELLNDGYDRVCRFEPILSV